ncbi:PPP4R2 domain-containing protein [Ditylenchus destructor]|nr:PPP4R2 domain-containing protein [Ditylenchus destructor]
MVQPAAERKRQQFRPVSEYHNALSNFSPLSPEKENKQPAEFTKSEDPLVDEYFHFVSANGCPALPWTIIKSALVWKLQTVMNDMHMHEAEKLEDDIVKENLIKNEAIVASKTFIMEKARSFDGTPFTIQRLCELLTTPTRHYNSTEKFLRALEKNINVVTTVTETGERITGTDDFEPEDDGSPIPVERNFIVSVDELDEPLPTVGPVNAASNSMEKPHDDVLNGLPAEDDDKNPSEMEDSSNATNAAGDQAAAQLPSLDEHKEEKMEIG